MLLCRLVKTFLEEVKYFHHSAENKADSFARNGSTHQKCSYQLCKVNTAIRKY